MEILTFSQAEIQPRIMRFSDLKATEDFVSSTGDLSPDARKAVFSQAVYGLTSPTGASVRNFWEEGAVPAGTDNFGAVYVTAGPGEGASMHVHRYSWENFIPLKGHWRIFWNAPEIEEHVDLAPHDMVSIPPGAIRRFEYIGEGKGLMLAFAYAGTNSLLSELETTLPPCEIERLEKLGAEGTAEQADYAARMRELLAASEAIETEADRDYLRSVKAYVAGEAGKG